MKYFILRLDNMEKELKEWIEKYDEKLKSFGFYFKRITDGFPYERATCLLYKKYNTDLLVFYDEDKQKVLIDLTLIPSDKRKKSAKFMHLTTEEVFRILEGKTNVILE